MWSRWYWVGVVRKVAGRGQGHGGGEGTSRRPAHWNPGREESDDVGEDMAVDRRSDAAGFLEGGEEQFLEGAVRGKDTHPTLQA